MTLVLTATKTKGGQYQEGQQVHRLVTKKKVKRIKLIPKTY
jgi:hypothetical protein